ncbi:transmembrane protein 126A-like isoform X3 [Eretmochelys imbricata]
MSGRELELNSPQENARLRHTNKNEALLKMFVRLPEADQKLLTHGSYFLGINGGFCGLIANSFFRRILNVTEARIASSLPMAVLPFLTTAAIYHGAVTVPLMSGDLMCATCALVRGGLIGSVIGGLYPIFLAIPINAGLAARQITSLPPLDKMRVYFTPQGHSKDWSVKQFEVEPYNHGTAQLPCLGKRICYASGLKSLNQSLRR